MMTTIEEYEAKASKLDSYAGIIPLVRLQEEKPKALPLEALDAHALALMQFKMRDVILSPWLHSQDLCMVFAARGIGKTHFALAVAFAVATGGTFAKWTAPQPRKVLYLDGELPGRISRRWKDN
jgi:hypothetical protein